MTAEMLIDETVRRGSYVCEDVDVAEYDRIHVDVSSNGDIMVLGYTI